MIRIKLEELGRFANNSWSVGLLKLFAAGCQLAFARLAIEYLGIADYSTFLIIFSLSGWISLTDLGYGVATQNKYSSNSSQGLSNEVLTRELVSLQHGLFITLALPTIVATIVVANILIRPSDVHESSLIWAVLAGASGWFMSAVFGSVYKVLFAMHRPFLASLSPSIGFLLSPILLFIAVHENLFPGYKLLVCVFCSSAPLGIAALITSIVILPHKLLTIGGRWGRFCKSARSHSREAFRFSMYALVVCLSTNSDYIVISQTLTSLEISQYYITTKSLGAVYLIVYSRMLQAWPSLTELFTLQDYNRARSQIKRVALQSSVAIVIIGAILTTSSGQISRLFSNGEVPIPPSLLALSSVYFLVRSYVDIYAVAMCACGKSGLMAITLSLQAIVSIFLQYFMSTGFGVPGLLIGLSVAFAVTSLWINPLLLELTVIRPLIRDAKQ